jgi:YihY family inner membrane protein
VTLNLQPSHAATTVVDRLPAPLAKVVTQARDHDVLLFASSLAFHALVSVAPLTIVVLWLGSLIIGDSEIERMAAELSRAAPEGLGAGDALTHVAELGTTIGVPSLIAALWPATAYGAGLRRGFARLSGEEKRLKGLRGLVLLALLPLFVLGVLLGSYFATTLVGSDGADLVIGVIGALITGFLAAVASIALIYRIFTSRSLSWRAILEATVWTAAAISTISLLFTLYLTAGANFQEHFATSGIAGIVLLGVWLYLSNALLLTGYVLALVRETEGKG